MKRFLFLLTAAIAAMSMFAAPVDQTTALRKAQNYLANEMFAGQLMAPSMVNPVLIKTEMGNSKINKPVYYIYNTETTFLVVAGDDRAEEILMIGDEPLDLNRIPCGMQWLLDSYKDQISFLQEHPDLQVERLSDKRGHMLRAETYGPLLTAKWDQEAPYWAQCKFTYNNRSYQCLTGCPATSASMVMYYWKYPSSVSAMSSYTSTLDISSSQSVSYTYPSLTATTFDWNSMRDTYTSSTTGAPATAVATLMRYVGQAEKMMYGVSSVGSGIYHGNGGVIATMFKNWGYKSTARLVYKSSNSEDGWVTLLANEMAAGRPIVFMALTSGGEGHAFNVDGYRDSDSKFHVNFGWSGYGNSWYAMNAFSYSGDTFNYSQQAIIGIESPNGQPQSPELAVEPSSLSFTGCTAGETYTKTFTVTGVNLDDGVTISKAGSSYITVSPTSLTKAQATSGATVTVTYAPTAGGTHSATLTIASNGATSKTITVSGSATSTATGPTLIPNPTSLSFNTTVGTPVTQTFSLTGTNLTNTVYLSVSGEGFDIDKTVVSKTGVLNGTTITVTYNPETGGDHTGTVTITSSGAEAKTVTLNGTATALPRLTVDPSSLSFNTTVGQSVTKTFVVQGYDLTGNVSLSCSGTGFSIDKDNISRTAATNGSTITVTYNPTAAGNHTGTVTLTSSGANPVTVSLTGTATAATSLSANPTSLDFNTVIGTPVTKTFTVTGINLTANVTVVCNGTGFTCDKNSIPKADAANGATVTVTYNPTTVGNHTGTVTLISSGTQSVTVSLNGTATEPVRTITVTPSVLNFNTLVGQPINKTFIVSGENLTSGNLTLTLSGGNGAFSITPTTITAAQAMAGNVPVTVTFAPTTFGTQSAIVTVSGGGAPAATVTLNGQADLIKYAPVMLPANEEYINLTQFRADWTDQTPVANVASYTLEVNPKDVPEPEPEPELIASLSGTQYSGSSYYQVTLTAPWSGENTMGHNNQIIYFRNNYQGTGTTGYIAYTVPAGYENAVFTVKITSGTSAEEAIGNLTVSTPQTAGVTYYFNPQNTYAWLVTASTGEMITITTPDDNYSPDIALIEIYSGNATVATFRANETETENGGRLITGITDKFYTVENLAPAGTFLYRVKSIYLDGTESDWSNVEEVTLFGHGYAVGDVNHDGNINISDVTTLINALLSGTIPCDICCDVNQDNNVNISDVTTLINNLLAGNYSSVMMKAIRGDR